MPQYAYEEKPTSVTCVAKLRRRRPQTGLILIAEDRRRVTFRRPAAIYRSALLPISLLENITDCSIHRDKYDSSIDEFQYVQVNYLYLARCCDVYTTSTHQRYLQPITRVDISSIGREQPQYTRNICRAGSTHVSGLELFNLSEAALV